MNEHKILGLRVAFEELAASEVDGVKGVWAVHSGKPGPVVGITVMTHGNEPAGLATYRYFRHEYGLEGQLQCGSVYFVLNNIEATRRYFDAVVSGDEEAKKKSRFIDVNMNRLPVDPFLESDGGKYEVARVRELRTIWDRFDHALDIHSTSQNASPMIIVLERSNIEVASQFPIVKIISNIGDRQAGRPASYFYGREKAMVYGIEAGTHEAEESFDLAITCALLFLSLLGLIPKTGMPERIAQEEYRVFDSIWFPDGSYELEKVLPNFEQIHKGQILAHGNGDPIVAGQDCYALMGLPQIKPVTIDEEVLFLARRLDHPVA